jgi:hypothetical protein
MIHGLWPLLDLPRLAAGCEARLCLAVADEKEIGYAACAASAHYLICPGLPPDVRRGFASL